MVLITVLILSPQSLVNPVTLASLGSACCDFPVRCGCDKKKQLSCRSSRGMFSYLKKSMSTSSSIRSACPMTGLKKSSQMRLGVMVCSREAARRIRAKRS